MNISIFLDRLSLVGADKILLLALTIVAVFFIKRLKGVKKRKKLCAILPFAVGICFSVVYSLAVKNCETFSSASENGVETGSLATVLYTVISSFLREDKSYEEISFEKLVLESLLAGYIADDKITDCATHLENVIASSDKDGVYINIVSALTENGVGKQDAEALAKIIVNVLIATT